MVESAGGWWPAASHAVYIVDTRSCRVSDRHRLEGDAARLYKACDEAVDRDALRNRLGLDHFEEIVDTLLASKILLQLNGRLLALAVDTARQMPQEVLSPGGRIAWDAVAQGFHLRTSA